MTRPGATDRTIYAALGAAFVVNAQWAWDGGRPADATVFLRAAVDRADKVVPSPMVSDHPRLLLAAMLTSIGELTEANRLIELSSERIRGTFDTLWAPRFRSRWLDWHWTMASWTPPPTW